MSLLYKTKVDCYTFAVYQTNGECRIRVFYHDEIVKRESCDTREQGIDYIEKNKYGIIFNHMRALEKRVRLKIRGGKKMREFYMTIIQKNDLIEKQKFVIGILSIIIIMGIFISLITGFIWVLPELIARSVVK